MSIEQSWRVIAAAIPTTRPPASEDDIARVEDVIGAALLEDVRASLRLHDGVPANDMFDVLGDGNDEDVYEAIMGCDAIIEDWLRWRELRACGDIGDDMWAPAMVPLADGERATPSRST